MTIHWSQNPFTPKSVLTWCSWRPVLMRTVRWQWSSEMSWQLHGPLTPCYLDSSSNSPETYQREGGNYCISTQQGLLLLRKVFYSPRRAPAGKGGRDGDDHRTVSVSPRPAVRTYRTSAGRQPWSRSGLCHFWAKAQRSPWQVFPGLQLKSLWVPRGTATCYSSPSTRTSSLCLSNAISESMTCTNWTKKRSLLQ